MVQGGIQGDEASGFVTSEILTNATVKKGNLLIIPRANPPSIHVRKRQVNVDLNRRFDKDYNQFYEDRLARVIRYLVSKSDALIHLHEGSGFYSPTHVDARRNPYRYGQSVIIDTNVYKNRIFLADFVENCLKDINQHVKPAKWQFELFNTKTFSNHSAYLEQRKSLTYHALKDREIPALAIEVSKDISDLDWKVRHQLMATTVILHHFGVDVQLPDITDNDFATYPKDKIQLLVNGALIKPQTSKLTLSTGTPLRISWRPATASTSPMPILGVFASDRPGINLAETPRMPLSPFSTLDVRVDGVSLGQTNLNWKKTSSNHTNHGGTVFGVWHNNEFKTIAENGTLHTAVGDRVILEGIVGSNREEILNFKGFVASSGRNDGQDAGEEIVLDPDAFRSKFFVQSTPGSVVCEVVRETPNSKPAKFFISIEQHEILALRLSGPKANLVDLPLSPDDNRFLQAGTYVLEEIVGNAPNEKVMVFADIFPMRPGYPLVIANGETKPIILRLESTFAPIGSMTVTGTPADPIFSPKNNVQLVEHSTEEQKATDSFFNYLKSFVQ